jgi:hypothetical protein
MLPEDEIAALYSLGADALEAVLGDHFEDVWSMAATKAQEVPQVAVALEDVILLPDLAQASEVERLLAELRSAAWRQEDLPGHRSL